MHPLKTAKCRSFAMLLGLGTALAGATAWAQQRQMSPEEMRQFEQMMGMSAQEAESLSVMIELGVYAFFFVLFGVILLIARRNMKGWDQPIKDVWFAFSGRLNRKAYWLKGVVLVAMISIVVQLFGALLGLVIGSGIGAVLGGITLLAILVPFMVFNVWVGLAISIKRFHDLGNSGWWVLGMFVPFLNIWLGIKLAFFRGTIGPNTYGPDPFDPVNDYINELTGGGDDGDAGDEGGEPVHPQPRPPEGGGDAPKGFGTRKFTKPSTPVKPAPGTESEPDLTPAEMPGGSANLEVIKRRLGDDIMRPIKRKGGGQDAEG